MVRALLDGSKTQTRRAVKAKHIPWIENSVLKCLDGKWNQRPLPYGQPGDQLWVRETCRGEELESGIDGIRYSADNHFAPIENTQRASINWLTLHTYRGKRGAIVPTIHMPRWASRITLEITAVRVERLHACNEVDAIAEGAKAADCTHEHPSWTPYRLGYCKLWESINGPGSWDKNPWVWVVEFKVIKK